MGIIKIWFKSVMMLISIAVGILANPIIFPGQQVVYLAESIDENIGTPSPCGSQLTCPCGLMYLDGEYRPAVCATQNKKTRQS